MATYIALLRKDPDSHYGVEFPDFPGCVTAGVTLEEARRMAAEALELHVEGLVEDRAAIPAASSLDHVMADPHNAKAVPFLVDVPEPDGPAVRVNITLMAGPLRRIDEAAERAGLSRSAYLVAQALTVPILSPSAWSEMHGSEEIEGGRLRAYTDTDYLVFQCPKCQGEVKGGHGIRLEGRCADSLLPNGRPGLLFTIACPACGFTDHFKIALEAPRPRVASVRPQPRPRQRARR